MTRTSEYQTYNKRRGGYCYINRLGSFYISITDLVQLLNQVNKFDFEGLPAEMDIHIKDLNEDEFILDQVFDKYSGRLGLGSTQHSITVLRYKSYSKQFISNLCAESAGYNLTDPKWEVEAVINSHQGAVISLSFSSPIFGAFIASCSTDGSVKVHELVYSKKGVDNYMTKVDTPISDESKEYSDVVPEELNLSRRLDPFRHKYSVNDSLSWKLSNSFKLPGSDPNIVHFLPDSYVPWMSLMACFSNGSVIVYQWAGNLSAIPTKYTMFIVDIASVGIISTVSFPSLVLENEHLMMALGTSEGTVQVWSLGGEVFDGVTRKRRSQMLFKFDDHTLNVNALAWSPSHTSFHTLVSVSDDMKVVIREFKKKVDEHALPSIKNVSESLRGLNKQAIDRNAVGRVCAFNAAGSSFQIVEVSGQESRVSFSKNISGKWEETDRTQL